MKETVYFDKFVDAFKIRKEDFSYEGLVALFDYLENYEQETDQELELDVIALCCDFTESSIKDVLEDHDLASIEDLENNTFVIPVDSETVIYQNY